MPLSAGIFLDKTVYGLVLAVLAGIGGVLFEATLVAFEQFFYFKPYAHVMGVPLWLPLIYIVASIVIGNFARKLQKA